LPEDSIAHVYKDIASLSSKTSILQQVMSRSRSSNSYLRKKPLSYSLFIPLSSSSKVLGF